MADLIHSRAQQSTVDSKNQAGQQPIPGAGATTSTKRPPGTTPKPTLAWGGLAERERTRLPSSPESDLVGTWWETHASSATPAPPQPPPGSPQPPSCAEVNWELLAVWGFHSPRWRGFHWTGGQGRVNPGTPFKCRFELFTQGPQTAARQCVSPAEAPSTSHFHSFLPCLPRRQAC